MTATAHPRTGQVRLRELRWQDLDAVSRAEAELFPDSAWSLASWWGELAARPRREYLVADDGGELGASLLGYGGLDHGGETSDIMTIAVLPAGRRRGLGRAILDEMLDRARRRGAERVVLEVRADNDAALALYRQAGFASVHVRRGYYPGGVDAAILSLDLTRRDPAGAHHLDQLAVDPVGSATSAEGQA